ncbi:hypothetical protein KAFR_0B00700 [Kazachstania africana CBS 2517]|uniref:PCI domain-containing protein n=1 Tax=Kazachstania africana (strain ATCC 22294 / BCRC 22015 / CBS 2517 / CECT 1963 / NBRC 1671 / NRRL Y-8276) TaxID=1071382 RepID=H2APR9_KAZAF|nr:hypothetical protein KAFR_0B00700 [Kazachstania africana CBS 2517]CCF56369.1 hypothetical protein KAFR_0B00700 [Kazachstania africana CBS 2517]
MKPYNQVTPFALGKRKQSNNSSQHATNQESSIPMANMTQQNAFPQMVIPPPDFMPLIPPNSSSQLLFGGNMVQPKTSGILTKRPKIGNVEKWSMKSMSTTPDDFLEEERRRRRAARFGNNDTNVPRKKNTYDTIQDEEDFSDLNAISTKSHKFDKNIHIVGTCQNLEKSYLRLTSEPNPELVRPLNILKQAFTFVLNRYQKEHSYAYFCDQFKSIRQDLRVQMIENNFTIKVYQTHARVALENNDLGEFNQCQSRLLYLYETPTFISKKKRNAEEFTVYLILYYLLTDNANGITSLKLQLSLNEKTTLKSKNVQLAFNMATAKLTGNYHQFMKIYSTINGPAINIIDAFIEKERLKALDTICKSYMQLNLDFLWKELHFKNLLELITFLRSKNLLNYIVTKNEGMEDEFKYLGTKACRPIVSQLYLKSKKVDIKGQK